MDPRSGRRRFGTGIPTVAATGFDLSCAAVVPIAPRQRLRYTCKGPLRCTRWSCAGIGLEGNQMVEADQWPQVLAAVKGTIVRGTERVSSNRLMDLLGVEDDPTRRREVGKRLRAPMRALGWQGPRAMRIRGENGHSAGCSGYWRSRSRSRQPVVPVESDVGSLSADLPVELEQVTRQGLRKLSRILRMPLDVSDPSLTRSQVTAAGIAINAQLRADEQRLRAKVQSDTLDRLLELIEAERKRRELEDAD